MHPECIIAEFDDVEKARLGLEVLATAGYGEEHVSVVTRRDDPAISDFVKVDNGLSDSEGAKSGAGVGGVLGGAISIPLAASTLIGPFILVGPLVGLGLGAALGGALGGAGAKEKASQRYRESLEKGGILIVVNGSKAELYDAEASIKTAGPTRVTRFAGSSTN